jgi:hypothetical protein
MEGRGSLGILKSRCKGKKRRIDWFSGKL